MTIMFFNHHMLLSKVYRRKVSVLAGRRSKMKIVNFFRSLCVLLLASLMVGGCKERLIYSIEDLNTEKKIGSWFTVYQYRTASIPGLLPFSDMRFVYYDKLFSSPSAAIGLNRDKSFIVTTEVDFKGECGDLIKLRNKLMELKRSAIKVVSDKMYLNSLRYTKTPENKDTQKLENQKEEALKAYKCSRAEFEDKHKEVTKALNQKGVFIYRWTTTSGVQGDLGLGDILTGNFFKEEQYNGFAIVGGLRVSTLYVGKDLVEKWAKQNWFSSNFPDDFKVTTYLMQAKYILYISEHEFAAELAGVIKASYSQLKDLPKTIRKLDEIELSTIASSLFNFSNTGFFGEAQYFVNPIYWEQEEIDDFRRSLNKSKGWQPFFSVQTELDDLTRLSGRVRKRIKEY